jgi:hypothetical protein
MEEPEIKRLAETVEAGMRDGRSLESLRKAMQESGYNEEDIRAVVGNVDRKKIIRRPKRKAPGVNMAWVASGILVVVIIALGTYILLMEPPEEPIAVAEIPNTSSGEEVRTCYVVNESIKQVMIDAGAKCDKWYLIKEI